MGKSHRASLAMRFLWISLLALVLAATVQAEECLEKEKVQLGRKKCVCDLCLDMGEKCKGTAKCDKKCSGSGEVEFGGCTFTLTVKKGKGKISKCSCVIPTEPTTGSGSGETPVPITGSGSGETPVPITGSGSGGPPMPITGSGSEAQPAEGEGIQCSCKCDCPNGSGECDCDCNCPMTSKAVNCAPGFCKVCPMVGDACPQDMEPICPNNAMSRMAGGAGDGHMADRGCQCVPDFLMDMVKMQPLAPAGRMTAVDRAITKATIQVGKKKCKCSYEMNAENCKKSKITCDKKCSGKASGVELEDGMYMLDIAVKKGKVTIAKCDVQAAPAPTGTGGGSGGMGSGSASGNGGGGMGGIGSRCACVSMGMGGTGPVPPPGSGTVPTGSGSGTVPTGSGSGPAPTGSGSGPVTLLPPTGSGSGSGNPEPIETVTRVKLELFTGLSEADEPISFDGQTVTVAADTQFDPAKPIKVVIHGWYQASLDNFENVVVDNDEYPRSFNQLYMSNGMDYTILGVHWVPIEGWNEELMSASSSDAANTLGLLVYSLYNDFNISPSQIHVIGFSMGTVVTSKTVKKIQELGMGPLGRLTLLDPCPYYQANVISKTDATFVEAIHTSSQDICSESPLAHVDYYPNGGDAQPCGTDSCSCPDGSLVCATCYHGASRCIDFFGNPDWIANHMRAVDLYRESIGRPSAFLSWKCSETYEEFVESDRSCQDGGANEKIPMGEHSIEQGTPVDGLYFLTTPGVSPFYE